ncbi:MAG TPA: DUF167 domain-containing protein [Syntrophorhabdaceae bacterium]|jgi:hypothetical protein|nr:hypothetical protein [Syntrophorhabdaceae bacterium]MDI9562248.1 DUF167 domain-containing protein [Pseudomonadota bacterium]HNQ63557.1 DUF167 domain-containing protein [Syntrophorhabdaceae bacterium]HNZ58373.1 DUF167 domain-containing protein [Syntrophorhabdaceae bacterium]HOG39346.1 DUF167 domain-containing protein [Syntrophorhabdaceae bacterium]
MNIEIRVVPNAKKREIVREGFFLKVKLISSPRDGKANEELIEFLSDTFRVKKSEIKIIRGEKDRRKVVFIPVDNNVIDTIC